MSARPLVLACLIAVACKGTSSKPAPAPPRDGRALATTASLPRADWPNAMVIFDRESLTAQRATIEYTSDEPCAMSVALHARGIVGCPARIVHTNGDGSQSTREIVYDAQRRIVDDGLDKYVWDDAGVVDRVDVTYQQLAGSPNLAAVRKDGSHRSRWQVENGRALAEYGPSSKDAEGPGKLMAELTWGAKRLERIDERLHRTYLAYADAPVAAYPEDAERKQREAADHDAAALATLTAPPRATWPCVAETRFDDGTGRELTFVYGDRTTCKFPVEVVAEGLVGCPVAIEIRERAADGTLGEPLKRDVTYAGDNMTAGYTSHRWRDDGLAAGRGTFERTATGVRDVVDGNAIDYDLTGGRLVAVRATGLIDGSLALRWDGDRLAAIKGSFAGTTREITLRACP